MGIEVESKCAPDSWSATPRKEILNNLSFIPLDYATEAIVPNAKPLSTQELRNLGLVDQVSFGVIVCFISLPQCLLFLDVLARVLATKIQGRVQLFIWYDYFCCPQHENAFDLCTEADSHLCHAIASIHCCLDHLADVQLLMILLC